MSLIFDVSNIDASFDHQFENNNVLTWFPWVGKNFINQSKKTLILGESTYNWNPNDSTVQERINRKDHLRLLHQNHALNFNRNSKYVRNIERAIYNTKTPKPETKEHLWSSVVYHNLVLRPMATLKHRPTYNDYKTGWLEVLNLLNDLAIDQCIVYGLEKEKIHSLIEVANNEKIIMQHKRSLAVGRSRPSVVTLEIKDKKVKLVFIRHPSAFFSWKKWAVVLNSEGMTLG